MRIAKKFLILLVSLAFVFVLLQRLLPLIVPGGVGGSFGLRPTSHRCVGLRIKPRGIIEFLPKGDIEFQIPYMLHFRYVIPHEPLDREFCLGQDVWYGE